MNRNKINNYSRANESNESDDNKSDSNSNISENSDSQFNKNVSTKLKTIKTSQLKEIRENYNQSVANNNKQKMNLIDDPHMNTNNNYINNMNPVPGCENVFIHKSKNITEEDIVNYVPTNYNNDKLVHDCAILHPCLINEDKTLRKIECCSTMGCFGCCKCCRTSELENCDLGISIYFKTLKSLLSWLLIVAIINAGLMYIYYINNTTLKLGATYLDVFYKFSIGNIASALINCNKVNLTDFYSKSDYTMVLDCQDYDVLKVERFGLTQKIEDDVSNQVQCQNFTTSMILSTEKSCDLTSWANDAIDKSKVCNGLKKCYVPMDSAYVKKNCINNIQNDYIYFSYSCRDKDINLMSISISRDLWALVVISVDGFCVVSLIITILIIYFGQRNTKKEYFNKKVLINKYTIRISNIRINFNNLHNELDDLIGHLNVVLRDEKNLNDIKINLAHNNLIKVNVIDPTVKKDSEIYEINFQSMSENKLNLISKKTKLYNQLSSLKNKYYVQKMKNNVSKIHNIENEYRSMKSKYEIMNNLLDSNKEILEHIEDIFVSYVDPNEAYYIYRLYKRTKSNRFWVFFCCHGYKIKHLYYKNKWLDIQYCPDEPSNIKWINMTYSNTKRFFLKLLSLSIAIFLILIGFGVVIAGKYLQEELTSNFNPNINCDYVDEDITKVIFEINNKNIPPKAKINTNCYCKTKLFSTGYFSTLDYVLPNNNIKPCYEWIIAYTKYVLIVYGIVFIIPVINGLLKLFIKSLTNLERNKTFSEDKISNMLKLSVSQFINVAITIVLVNMYIREVKDWNKFFPIFTGNYTDLNSTWFLNIGGTITFAMMLNIFIPHILNFLIFMFNCCKRKIDSGNLIGIGSKQTIKEYFMNIYIGPEFNVDIRYAMTLASFFICLLYSAGMPIMYPILFITVFITYWLDKWLFTKFYRLPPKYDLSLSDKFLTSILYVIVLHLSVSIWIYGSTQIFPQISILGNYINLVKGEDEIYNFITRMFSKHNVILLGLLAIIVLYLIVKLFSIDKYIFSLFCESCSSSDKYVNGIALTNALSIEACYKNYKLRYQQFLKVENTDKKKNLTDFYETNLERDKSIIINKLKDLHIDNIEKLEDDFDEHIDSFMKENNIIETALLQKDFSYNIAHLPEYEAYAI